MTYLTVCHMEIHEDYLVIVRSTPGSPWLGCMLRLLREEEKEDVEEEEEEEP